MDRKDERDDWRVLKLTAPAWTTRVGRIMIRPHGPTRMKLVMFLTAAALPEPRLNAWASWSLDHGQTWVLADQIEVYSPGMMSRVFDEVNTELWCADVELIAGAMPAECEVRAREMTARS